MAVVAPTISNGCLGSDIDGEPLQYFKCQAADSTKSCQTSKIFYVTCSNPILTCNQLSNAYVAAITVCRQNLYTT